MATVSVEVKGTKEMQRALKRAGDRALHSLGAALFQEGEAVMAKSKKEVPVDEGVLRASGFTNPPKQKATAVEVQMGYGGAAKGYAVFLHEGTGPAVGRPQFFPPVDVIAEWADRKGIDIDPFVLARSIGRKGLKPRKFLERPLKKQVRGMGNRLARRMRRDLDGRA